MREIVADVRAAMELPGILSATVAEGFPYADVAEMGMSVVVVSDGDAGLGERVAADLARAVWDRRDEFDGTAPTADAAVTAVLNGATTPVLLLDVGDNIGGGSGGDSVVILDAARRAGLASLLTIVADAAAVETCERAGCGASPRLAIGGRSSASYGPPVEASGVVLGFDDGVLVSGERSHAGMNHLDAGRSAAVRLDTGQTVILTSKVAPPFNIEQVTRFGLDPAAFDAIVAKGVHSPLATYLPYVADAIFVDTPGPTAANLRGFDYERRRRPLFPFEAVAFSP
jgi:microcystin degradation protein MlrC